MKNERRLEFEKTKLALVESDAERRQRVAEISMRKQNALRWPRGAARIREKNRIGANIMLDERLKCADAARRFGKIENASLAKLSLFVFGNDDNRLENKKREL